jgi:YD repeat-containing protein
MNINREDGDVDYLTRVPSGRGFNPNAVYESRDLATYGARLSWNTDHYELRYRNGDSATFLPCVAAGSHCYWTSYHDAKATMNFDRRPDESLRQITATDHQGIEFEIDDQQRTTKAAATDGTSVSYEYDAAGCLSRVVRADGQITFYKYDPDHRMTAVSVARQAGASPETILANEYDSQGRITRQTLAGGTYQIEYGPLINNYASRLKFTTPTGEQLDIVEHADKDEYIVRSAHVQFPFKQH